jgi:hypothetical protein
VRLGSRERRETEDSEEAPSGTDVKVGEEELSAPAGEQLEATLSVVHVGHTEGNEHVEGRAEGLPQEGPLLKAKGEHQPPPGETSEGTLPGQQPRSSPANGASSPQPRRVRSFRPMFTTARRR